MKSNKNRDKGVSSSELFAVAKTLMPGGVSSPVRAIKPYPFYTERASGAHLKEYSPLRPSIVSGALSSARAGLEMRRKRKPPWPRDLIWTKCIKQRT